LAGYQESSQEGEALMAPRRLPPRDAKGRFTKRLPPAVLERLGMDYTLLVKRPRNVLELEPPPLVLGWDGLPLQRPGPS
jgi:hypothetical protein